MVNLRPLIPTDIDDLYSISLLTGHLGGDATKRYNDPLMMGHIYSAPYATLVPDMCFVAEDSEGVAGYVVGTLDTGKFEIALERLWWPALRKKYPAPNVANSDDWSADKKRSHMIHFPEITPESVTRRYPAHLHLNILPRLQGQGMGKALCQTWVATAISNGAKSAHVGVNPLNSNAIQFWKAVGFQLLNDSLKLPGDRTLWFGRQLTH